MTDPKPHTQDPITLRLDALESNVAALAEAGTLQAKAGLFMLATVKTLEAQVKELRAWRIVK